jgi:hypothetical protein
MVQENRKGSDVEWHLRAGQSHAEARRLLTSMAVGTIGVLYATVVGKEAPSLQNGSEYLAIAIVASMALSALYGLFAWRVDAAWAYQSAIHQRYKGSPKARDKWHNIKNGAIGPKPFRSGLA